MYVRSGLNQNIAFKSAINIVDYERFKNLIESENMKPNEKADHPYTIDCMVKRKSRAYTEIAADCNAGGITNTQKVSLFHFVPNEAVLSKPKLAEVIEELDTQISRLTEEGIKKGKEVRAFITGGRQEEYHNRKNSKKLFNVLNGIFRKKDLKMSIIWGQNHGCYTNLHYSARTDTWTLCNLDIWNFRDYLKINSLEDLLKVYKIVKIASGDTLCINGIPVSRYKLK